MLCFVRCPNKEEKPLLAEKLYLPVFVLPLFGILVVRKAAVSKFLMTDRSIDRPQLDAEGGMEGEPAPLFPL